MSTYLFVVVSNVDEDEAKLAELVLPRRTLGANKLAFFSGISDLE